MGSNDVVTVYQAVLEKCDCSLGDGLTHLASPVDPAVNIATNLLFENRDSRKLRVVSPGEFKPWYGKCKSWFIYKT